MICEREEEELLVPNKKLKQDKRVKARVSKYPDREVGLKGVWRHLLPRALFWRHAGVAVVTLHHGLYSKVVGRCKPVLP